RTPVVLGRRGAIALACRQRGETEARIEARGVGRERGLVFAPRRREVSLAQRFVTARELARDAAHGRIRASQTHGILGRCRRGLAQQALRGAGLGRGGWRRDGSGGGGLSRRERTGWPCRGCR